MHLRTITIWVLLFCMLPVFIGCKKFLSTYSQNNSFIESASDLDELLVGSGYIGFRQLFIPDMLYSMDDDLQLGTFTSNIGSMPERGFHFWQAEPRMNALGQLSNTDNYYNFLYSRIARINTILHNVPALKGKETASHTLNRISGEAHFLRGLYYFMLVNLYGKPYKVTTAATDFGIPLKTDPTIKDQFAVRSSVKQVYDQIVTDLLDAERELDGANESSTIRANQAAAQALLSRVYLYMENYKEALHYAEQVIRRNNYQLKNLNGHPDTEDFLTKKAPEVIFNMGANMVAFIMKLQMDIPTTGFYYASQELTSLYADNDLRREVFFKNNSKGQMRVAKKRKSVNETEDDVSDMFLIRLSEIYLNKAEALAGLDRFDAARNTLQEFRKNRFKPAELPTISSEGAVLMNTIRDERRRELCLESHRWFDLRRYAVNTKLPFSKTIRHRSIIFTGSAAIDNGYYELKPYEQDAAAYIVPIANDEIVFNQGVLINDIRPERPLQQ